MGFSGLSFVLRQVESIESKKGFKSLSFLTSNRQYIESSSGFKSLSLVFKIGGSARKIMHYRHCQASSVAVKSVVINSAKAEGYLTYSFTIQSSDNLNTASMAITVTFIWYYTKDGVEYSLGNKSITIPVGANGVTGTMAMDTAGITSAKIEVTGVTPPTLMYNTPIVTNF